MNALIILEKQLQKCGLSGKVSEKRLDVDIAVPQFAPFISSQVWVVNTIGHRLYFNLTLTFDYLASFDEGQGESYEQRVSHFESKWLPTIYDHFMPLIDKYGLRLDLDYQLYVDVDITGTFNWEQWFEAFELVKYIADKPLLSLAH